MDTIFALSTVFGKSGVALFRISGPNAYYAVNALKINKKINPRVAIFTKFYDSDNEIIDEGIIIYFPAPASFTGEDVIELNLHGSIAVINAMYKHLIQYFRIAERGEFTKRAFINGKFDLTAAEGIAALIDAETAAQRKQALKQISGISKDLYEKWRKEIIYIMAIIEAFIDFPDEDISENLIQEINEKVIKLLQNICIHLDDNKRGQKIKNGIKIAIIGPPNAGKSTLFNYFAKKNAAIVSTFPGTTRDIIEVNLDIEGFLVTIQDTAGIHETKNEIEKEGINRTNHALKEADLILLMLSSNEITTQIVDSFKEKTNNCSKIIFLISKCDIVQTNVYIPDVEFIYISVHNKIGLEIVYAKILDFLKEYTIDELPIITEERYRQALIGAKNSLETFLKSEQSIEILAENLRCAAQHIGSITGIIYSEEVLDQLFSKLCIGK